MSLSLNTLSWVRLTVGVHHQMLRLGVEYMVKGYFIDQERICHLICRSTIASSAGSAFDIQMRDFQVFRGQNLLLKSAGNLIFHDILLSGTFSILSHVLYGFSFHSVISLYSKNISAFS